jgi:hypothetical protein
MSLFKKFRIKPGMRMAAVGAPEGFARELDPRPTQLKWVKPDNEFDQMHWFVLNQAAMKKGLSAVMRSLKPGHIIWIYFPKGSSGLQTDLTRDKGWDCIDKEKDHLQFLTLVSLNESWSAFGYRVAEKTGAIKTKAIHPREVLQYIDPVSKEVRLPEYLQKALAKNKKALAVYNKLPFTHRKEYLEWILTAKKEETRDKRIRQMLEKLEAG